MTRLVPVKKTSLSQRALTRGLLAIGLVLCVECSTYAAGIDRSGEHNPSNVGYDTIHSIQVSKSQSSKKHKIRLYPDARQQVLFFSADGEDGKVYQLFLFDMDGRLVSQTHIRNKETTVLTNISEGNFLFEVFTDDERIENGQVTVR
ncbi:MAG TPA: T9SS type A sorting domain-containing protein [Puia sp.]|nr:T9SS type A sorting domain-containing protein [Puia sp.]